MIRKVYELNPLLWTECGAEMKIITFIEDHKVIDKIIRHLKLSFQAERPLPLKSFSRNSWWRMSNGVIISDSHCSCFLAIQVRSLSVKLSA